MLLSRQKTGGQARQKAGGQARQKDGGQALQKAGGQVSGMPHLFRAAHHLLSRVKSSTLMIR